MIYRTFLPLLTSTLISLPMLASAATCPAEIKQDQNGYWYSTQKPGWRSQRNTAPGTTTVQPIYFGGVVFSPKHQRMACVYKASDKHWIALVSQPFDSFHIDKQAVDDSGKKAAWQYNKQHDDFSCGRPAVSKVTGCPFTTE